MLVLGIESSCDETAVAIIEVEDNQPSPRYRIRSELVASQVDLHAKYGGVVPELAAREHLRSLPLLVDEALHAAGCRVEEIGHLAVTQGPGLKGCLMVGQEFAKGFALARQLPLLGVNHIEGHIHAARLSNPDLRPPFIALIVSGGHTELVYVKKLGEHQILGRTQDDAAGEAFDKSANLLGFAYPGGPQLAKLADSVSTSRFSLPRVMLEGQDFSFSGLKTAVSLLIRKNKDFLALEDIRAELAHSIQAAIVDALVHKTKQAAKAFSSIPLTVTGGVACNASLRKRLTAEVAAPVFYPEIRHCVDNAAMIALVAALRLKELPSSVTFPSEARPRWPVETLS